MPPLSFSINGIPMQYEKRSAALGLIVLPLLLLAIWLVFTPGLTGGLVFDDEPNLRPIQEIGGVRDAKSAFAFILSSDHTPGRPVSLLSFVLDDQYWPLNTAALKRTNLLIHLLNSLLVFWLAYLLIGFSSDVKASSKVLLSALLMALWALHPMHLSSVSYIIQRMAMLSALFSLAAMVCYCKLRPYLESRYFLVFIGLCGFLMCFWLLGILSKENALLIGLYLFLVESFFFSRPLLDSIARQSFWKLFRFGVFALPLLAFIIYWLWYSEFFSRGFEGREFTLAERIWTQPRVLWLYIKGILLPDLAGFGLFGDKLILSTGFLSPVSTAVSILSIMILLVVAFLVRYRAPLVSFGVFFYFSGHLLESTFVSLEIYFEHRNYLPMVGVWFAVIGLLQYISKKYFPLVIAFFACYLLLFAYISYTGAALWGDSKQLAGYWYKRNLESVRAAQFYASELHRSGAFEEARVVLVKGYEKNPGSLALLLTRDLLDCRAESGKFDSEKYISLARKIPMETSAFEALETYRKLLDQNEGCEGLSHKSLRDVYSAFLENPRFNYHNLVRSRVYSQLAKVSLSERNLGSLMYYYDKACESQCLPEIRLVQAEMLASAGLYEDSKEFLGKFWELYTRKLERYKKPHLGVRGRRLAEGLDKVLSNKN